MNVVGYIRSDQQSHYNYSSIRSKSSHQQTSHKEGVRSSHISVRTTAAAGSVKPLLAQIAFRLNVSQSVTGLDDSASEKFAQLENVAEQIVTKNSHQVRSH